MKLRMLGMAVLLSLVMTLPGAAFVVTSVSIEPDSTIVGVGSLFSVDVMVSNVFDLYAVDLDFTYDTAIMDFVGFTTGPFLSSDGNSTFVIPPVVNESAGTIDDYVETRMGPVPGISGSGILLTLDFIATGVGTGMIDVSALLAGDSQPPDPIFCMNEPGQVEVLIPEPASLLLVGSGLALLMRRRKS